MILSQRHGIIMVFAAAVGWSTAGFFARLLPTDIATTVLWRGWFGALGLLVLIVVLEGPQGLRAFGRLGRAGFAYAAVSGVGMLAFIGSLKMTSVAHVSIIYATVPFAAAGLDWLALGERPSRAAMLASVAALCGATVMVGLSRDGTLPGDALAALNVVVGACMIVIARASPGMPTLAAATLSAVWAPLACLPFASMALIDPATVGLLFAFGLINTTAALALFILGSRHLPAVKTALISALETPLTPFWVWLAFGDIPSAPTLAGGVIVFGAVVWYVRHEARTAL